MNVRERGQVMLITVLALSGTILGATTIAGLLMLYQIRQSTDIVNSSKAIFAADAGIEWRLYKFFKLDGRKCMTCAESTFGCPQPGFDNSASFETSCTVQPIANNREAITIRSTGKTTKISRALELSFIRISTPTP